VAEGAAQQQQQHGIHAVQQLLCGSFGM
jgi:hypothetical protein